MAKGQEDEFEEAVKAAQAQRKRAADFVKLLLGQVNAENSVIHRDKKTLESEGGYETIVELLKNRREDQKQFFVYTQGNEIVVTDKKLWSL